ncbi:hypothetical protein ACFX11_038532 [Malus domestica]
MAIPRLSLNRLTVAAIAAVIFGIAISAVQANPIPSAPAPAPAPASSNSHSDGTNIDQGIAYSLMVLALVLTYLIHSADIPGF